MLVPDTLESYLRQYPVTWAVNMPPNCPPQHIDIPHNHSFFRLTLHEDYIDQQDMKNYVELNPGNDWGDMLPLASGLSVYNSEDKARKEIKLPYLKKFNFKGIAKIALNPQDGVVLQTTKKKEHYTWWRTTGFNINNAQMLQL